MIEHYFDWAGTAPPDKDILTSSLNASFNAWGNPSSIHTFGAQAKNALLSARKKCAKNLGVLPETIFFTSGGTESNHIPLLSILNKPSNKMEKGKILISAIEHPALREMASSMKNCGIQVEFILPNKDGFITPEKVLRALTPDTLFISVMAVNNETGAVQPIFKIADAIAQETKEKRKPIFHVDCVQALGKIPLNINYNGIDSASFSAHKICGPRGIGLLYMAEKLEPFLRGGGQENGIRSGTENLFGAIAFAECIEKYAIPTDKNTQKESVQYKNFLLQKQETARFIKNIMALKGASVIPHSRAQNPLNEDFSPYIVQAAFKGIPGQVMVRALNEKGFYISTGSACSAKKQSRPILEAMGVEKEERENAVRFSFGPLTTARAINDLFCAVSQVVKDFT